MKPYNAGGFIFAKTKQEEQDLWAARKEALFTMVNTKPEGTEIWSTDVAVPLSRLADIIGKSKLPRIRTQLTCPVHSKEDCSKLGLFASIIGHVGDGNFHASMFFDPQNPEQKAAVGKVVHDMMDQALEMEGTVSGEHAIGIGKRVRLSSSVAHARVANVSGCRTVSLTSWGRPLSIS